MRCIIKLSYLIYLLTIGLSLAQDPGLIPAQVLQARGSEGGGGGDADEIRISEIRDFLIDWIESGGADNLKLPLDISHETYKETMLTFLSPDFVTVLFVEEDHPTNRELQVSINGKPKTCRGYFSENDGRPCIICHISRFAATPDEYQVKLIHHEFAGLARLEKNKGEQSDYSITKQLFNGDNCSYSLTLRESKGDRQTSRYSKIMIAIDRKMQRKGYTKVIDRPGSFELNVVAGWCVFCNGLSHYGGDSIAEATLISPGKNEILYHKKVLTRASMGNIGIGKNARVMRNLRKVLKKIPQCDKSLIP